MFKRFTCRYCGKEKALGKKDYDMGLRLAENAS